MSEALSEARRVALSADGQKIAYSLKTNGDSAPGPRMLLIHALAMDRSNWTDVLAHLPASCSVITVDCRGHGLSASSNNAFNAEMFADDIAAVMDDAGWPDALIAGCSMGGCVAMTFATRHAKRTTGLVLIDTTAWYGATAVADWAGRSSRAKAEGLQSLVSFQRSRWFSASFLQSQPEVVQHFIDVFLRNNVDSYVATCTMLGAFDAREQLHLIACPTGIVVGEDDYATPVAQAQRLHDAIAGSTLTILPGACHFTPIEVPEAVAKVLIETSLANLDDVMKPLGGHV